MGNSVARSEEWPKNFMVALTGNKDYEITRDKCELIGSIYLGLASLRNEKQQTVLLMHYRDKKTLREIGEIFDRSVENIRQTEAKGFRRLRHPARMRFINGIYEYCSKEMANSEERYRHIVEEKDDEIKRLRTVMKEAGIPEDAMPAPKPDPTPLPVYELPIEDLDLSVRSYNCLCRANVRTVRAVLDKVQTGKIFYVRNLGRKSVEEILNKLKLLGIAEDELSISDEAMAAQERLEAQKQAEAIEKRKETMAAMEDKKMRQQAYNTAASKAVQEISEKIINNGLDGLANLFEGDVLEMMSKLVKRFLPSERVVSILLRTEIPGADGESPYSELVDQNGFNAILREGYKMLNGRHDYATWQRYQFRAASSVGDKTIPSGIDPIDYTKISVNELNMRSDLKEYLIGCGIDSAAKLIIGYHDDSIEAKIRSDWPPEGLSIAYFSDPREVMYFIKQALIQIKALPNWS